MQFLSYFITVRNNWRQGFQSKRFGLRTFLVFSYIVGLTIFVPYFFDFIEARDGTRLNDIILEVIPPHDVSWITFFFLYVGLFFGLSLLILTPQLFLLCLQTYCLVTTFRIISITFISLLPPDGYIPLREPVAQFFTNGGKLISHDLFFSGHVSTILSVYFAMNKGWMKTLVLFFVAMVAMLLLLQHVHYTIDVVAAPVFAYISFVITKKMIAGFPKQGKKNLTTS